MDFAIAYDSEVALAVITLHGLVDLAEGWVGVVLTYVLVSFSLYRIPFCNTLPSASLRTGLGTGALIAVLAGRKCACLHMLRVVSGRS